MSLLSLPNEILLQIVEDSRPDDFEHLTQTCKLLHNIAKPLNKEHKHFKHLYSSPMLGSSSHSEKDCNEILFEALLDPLAARYPKYLRCYDKEIRFFNKPLIHYCLDNRDVVKEFLHKSTFLKRATFPIGPKMVDPTDVPAFHHDLAKWENNVKAGISQFVITALLLLLPGLEDITLSPSEFEREYFDSVMDIVARDAIAGMVHPLSRLRSINIQYCDDCFNDGSPMQIESGTPIQTLAPFVALPSIRRIVGQRLEGDGSRYNWPYDGHLSNIEELIFLKCSVDPPQLYSLLQPMYRLRVFRYSHLQSGGLGEYWEAAGVLRVLSESVGSTLEELSLTTSGDPPWSVVQTFKGFQRLKKLEFSTRLLYDDAFDDDDYIADLELNERYDRVPRRNSLESAEAVRLIDILPATVRNLLVVWDSNDSRSKQLFDCFTSSYEDSLLNLDKIVFHIPEWASSIDVSYDSIIDEIRRTGIKVTEYDGYDLDD